MRYTLMHKDVEVADMHLDDYDGRVAGVGKINEMKHMPMGTINKGMFLDTAKFKSWWVGRVIPTSRSGIRDFMESLGISHATEIVTKSLGLSLSDYYWIRPEGTDLRWSDVNFFDNTFSEDVGDLLFGKTIISGEMDLSSPDTTSEGNLKKRWKIIDGERCLLKGGTRPSCQEPFNEVIATLICESLKISHVNYWILWDEGQPYSVCPNFVKGGHEYVSAYHIMNSYGSRGSESTYGKYVRCCNSLGVDVVPFLDRMIVLDYIMANGDRHLNNFGLIRDPDSLNWIGPAPIYDTGSSLGFDLYTQDIGRHAGESSKPFSDSFEKQLSYVSSLDWFDPDMVEASMPAIIDVMSSSRDIVDSERSGAVVELITSRIDRIRRMM